MLSIFTTIITLNNFCKFENVIWNFHINCDPDYIWYMQIKSLFIRKTFRISKIWFFEPSFERGDEKFIQVFSKWNKRCDWTPFICFCKIISSSGLKTELHHFNVTLKLFSTFRNGSNSLKPHVPIRRKLLRSFLGKNTIDRWETYVHILQKGFDRLRNIISSSWLYTHIYVWIQIPLYFHTVNIQLSEQ